MRFLIFFMLILAMGFPQISAAALSERDLADIALAETYLNSFSRLKANFLQITDDGSSSEGIVYLSRPGKLRMQYDPPAQLVLIADGTFLIVDDKRYENPSYIPLNSTPAGLLVREHIKLRDGDLTVSKVLHQPGVVSISLLDSTDKDQGELTLVFSEKPFQLRQWRIVDQQQQTTTVSIFNIQLGIAVDQKLFTVKTKPQID
jgi:outer membrane lipoprotein-sorting protein